MHEFSLYGQITGDARPRTIQQLVGVTRMQPRSVKELHLLFKGQVPSGLGSLPSAGGSQAASSQEAQKTAKMLASALYHVQIVGVVGPDVTETRASNEDTAMLDGHDEPTDSKISWYMEFKDIPEPGKHPVSGRFVSRTGVTDGDIVVFMRTFGYEYISRFLVTGDKFYDQDITLFLHRVLQVPQPSDPLLAIDATCLDSTDDLQPLDGSGGYLLQASIDAVDGNNSDLRDRAARQLLTMKETLKQAVVLTPGDRLALDTRVVANRRN